MTQLPIMPRRVAPYVVSGVSGVHVLARMWRLSRKPASDVAFHVFLLKHSDVLLILGSGPVIVWQLAKRHEHPGSHNGLGAHLANGAPEHDARASIIAGVAHQLRQVFTTLLLGLGLIKRKANAGRTKEIPGLVERLDSVVSEGIDAVNVLDSSDTTDGRERTLGA